MAVETGYRATNDVLVYTKPETTLGAINTTATGFTELALTSFTIPEVSSPVEESAQVTGKYTKSLDNAVHRLDNQVYTFDLTFKGNASNIDFVMTNTIEDSASAFVLAHDYSFPAYKDATANGNSFKMLFQDVGGGTSLPDMALIGCIGTGFTIGQAIDSENGECTITMNCMTAYKPYYVDQAITSPTAYSTDSAYNIKVNDVFNINDGSAEDVMIYSWELSASRSVERIGAKDYTDCEPFGYAMTGAFEVSGSLVIKRDLSVADFMSKLSSDSVGVNIGKASGGLLIGVPTAKIDASSIDNGGSFLKQTIPFKAYSSTNSAGNIFSITTG